MAYLGRDLSKFQESSFEPLPPGDYLVRVIDTDVRDSKAGNPMLKATFEVEGPTHAGRKVFDNFVLNNDVAMSRLKALAKAGGHHNPEYIADSEELHGLTMIVKLKIREQDGFEPQNQITNFKPAKERVSPTIPPPPLPAVVIPPKQAVNQVPRRPWE